VREGVKIMRNKPGIQQENLDNGNVVVKNRLFLWQRGLMINSRGAQVRIK